MEKNIVPFENRISVIILTNILNSKQRTALQTACLIGNIEISNLLIKNGKNLNLDINLQNEYGFTALMLACNEIIVIFF